MDLIVVSLAALIASGLTLYSGFGLGTLLMPVAALFFPVEMAVAITAIVHLANNLFKLGLLGRQANRAVLLAFGLPAMAAALTGALLLGWLSDVAPLYVYQAYGRSYAILPLKLAIGVLILGFVALELWPRFATLAVDRKWLPLGGLLSGFFGGLSGHQGAFRSMFLLKTGLDKDAFVATGVVLAVMVDVARMSIYGWDIARTPAAIDWTLVIAATLAAFSGAWLGARLLKKITLKSVQRIVSALLVVVGCGLIAGVL